MRRDRTVQRQHARSSKRDAPPATGGKRRKLRREEAEATRCPSCAVGPPERLPQGHTVTPERPDSRGQRAGVRWAEAFQKEGGVLAGCRWTGIRQGLNIPTKVRLSHRVSPLSHLVGGRGRVVPGRWSPKAWPGVCHRSGKGCQGVRRPNKELLMGRIRKVLISA